MKLTKQEAIENHRKMWNWIADELEKGIDTNIYSDIFDIKVKYFISHNITQENRPFDGCYGCEYAHQVRASFCTCWYCPLDWPGGDCIGDNDRLYRRITFAHINKDYTEAAKLARQIANLPEREDV